MSQIETQLTKAKTELYRVRVMLLGLKHEDHKKNAFLLWQQAYDAFDKLQEWIGSR